MVKSISPQWRLLLGKLLVAVHMELKRQYIVDEDNHKVAVQLDIDTFEKIEDVLENYALVQFINADESETLSIEEAKKYYAALDKA